MAQGQEKVRFDQKQIDKATSSFCPSRFLGKGSHGSVYRGVLEDNKLVAIKKSSVGADHVSNDNSKKLENEIYVLSSLPESPHIINFLGTSRDSVEEKGRLLVMEFMPNGSLHDLLHAATCTPPSWPKRVEIAAQVSRAIQFLHEGNPVVIHRDIKSANVLFDSNWNAKLADFGLAVMRVDSTDHQASQPAGTIGYLDPCYTTPSKLSTKNDVYSYGVVLLEIISGQKAIDITRVPASIVEWTVPLIEKQRLVEICDKRIALPKSMESTIGNLLSVAALCVSSKVENRPSVSEIVARMDNGVERRVKTPCWTSLLRSLILISKGSKLGKKGKQVKCAAERCDETHSELSKGKLMLWEILADITLK